MLDDIPDGLFSLLGRLLKALLLALRLLVEVVLEGALDLLLNRLTYSLGWLVLRALSLGQWPRMPFWPVDLDRQAGSLRLQLFGGACILGLITWAILIFTA